MLEKATKELFEKYRRRARSMTRVNPRFLDLEVGSDKRNRPAKRTR